MSSVYTTGLSRTAGPQPLVGHAYRATGTPQGIPGNRSLGQFHPGQYLQYPRNLPHRDAHPIVQGVGCGHGPATHPVRRSSKLVRRQIGMLPTHLMATLATVADPHPVLGHFGSWHRRNIGDVGEVYPLLFQAAPTLRASFQGDRHIYGRLRDLLRPRGLTEGESTRTRLAPGTLGLAHPGAFGERRGLAFGTPPKLGVLGTQRLNGGGQRGDLPLQLVNQTLLLSDQPQQVFLTQGGYVFGQPHGAKYKPPGLRSQARAGNQLRDTYWNKVLQEEQEVHGI